MICQGFQNFKQSSKGLYLSLAKFNLLLIKCPFQHSLGTIEFIMPVQRGFSLRQLLTVEPVLFLYAFGLFMNVPVSQQYIYSRLSEAKGFPYHFQQNTGCEGQELNDSMKKLEKEVLAIILCFIQDKCFVILHLQSFMFIRSTERVLASITQQHCSHVLHYHTLHRNSCKKVFIFCMLCKSLSFDKSYSHLF